jgi:hypothetical protein
MGKDVQVTVSRPTIGDTGDTGDTGGIGKVQA